MSGMEAAERYAFEIAYTAKKRGATETRHTVLFPLAAGRDVAIKVDCVWAGAEAYTFVLRADGCVQNVLKFDRDGYCSLSGVLPAWLEPDE